MKSLISGILIFSFSVLFTNSASAERCEYYPYEPCEEEEEGETFNIDVTYYSESNVEEIINNYNTGQNISTIGGAINLIWGKHTIRVDAFYR